MWVEKNGPAWRIRDLINGKKVTLESGYPTKTAAKARMTALRADKMRGEFIDPATASCCWGSGSISGGRPTRPVSSRLPRYLKGAVLAGTSSRCSGTSP